MPLKSNNALYNKNLLEKKTSSSKPGLQKKQIFLFRLYWICVHWTNHNDLYIAISENENWQELPIETFENVIYLYYRLVVYKIIVIRDKYDI